MNQVIEEFMNEWMEWTEKQMNNLISSKFIDLLMNI